VTRLVSSKSGVAKSGRLLPKLGGEDGDTCDVAQWSQEATERSPAGKRNKLRVFIVPSRRSCRKSKVYRGEITPCCDNPGS
jgi:hypothetical protein